MREAEFKKKEKKENAQNTNDPWNFATLNVKQNLLLESVGFSTRMMEAAVVVVGPDFLQLLCWDSHFHRRSNWLEQQQLQLPRTFPGSGCAFGPPIDAQFQRSHSCCSCRTIGCATVKWYLASPDRTSFVWPNSSVPGY